MGTAKSEIGKIKMAFSSLSIYRNMLEDVVICQLKSLINYIDSKTFDLYQAVELYNQLYFSLINSCRNLSLKEHIIKLMILDENPFTKAAERKEALFIEQVFRKAIENDLQSLQVIAELSASSIPACLLKQQMSEEIISFNLFPLENGVKQERGLRGFDNLVNSFSASKHWSDCFDSLLSYYTHYGYGSFSLYKSFLWDHSGSNGFLRYVENSDPIMLSDLIDYEEERSEVINNTLQLLNGQQANNILLYGDRGTGKSSTVKAIVNEYHEQGLRIIEVPKMNLVDFGQIVDKLRNRTHKFILFVDDLAFEDNEENYTALKAALEGGIENKPQNVVIYATSNRRHLIKEKFSDRQGLLSDNRDEEIRAQDSIQEKLSLADRFGITVVFSSPDKSKYLKIVEGMVQKRGLEIDRELLHKEALKWELWYNGRSPRTARQFVDWLQGNMK